MLDLRQVDGREGRAREVARATQRTRQATGQPREGRGAQVEGGARLHDGPRALAAAVRRRHVPRQVRAQLELLPRPHTRALALGCEYSPATMGPSILNS